MTNLFYTENKILYNLIVNIPISIQYDIWNNVGENIWDDIRDKIIVNIWDNIEIDSFNYLNISPKTLLKIKSQIKNQVYE